MTGRQACGADTVDGTPCRRPSLPGVDRCEVHLPDAGNDGSTDRRPTDPIAPDIVG